MFNISKKKITFFIIIFLIFSIFLFYWKYPISIQQDNSTPLKYADIIKKISIKNPKNFIEAEKFIIQNNNVYGTLTALYLAKTYIVHNKIESSFNTIRN